MGKICSKSNGKYFRHSCLDVTQNNIKFRANGQTIKFKGFMTLYVEAKDDKDNEKKNKLPNLSKGDEVTATQIEPKTTLHSTTTRYTGSSFS